MAKDPSEWLPDLNECWYVDRVVQVRRKYQLTIDQAEAEAIDRVLAGCESTEMVILAQGPATSAAATPTPTDAPEVDALAMYDDNGNGRITCAEARAHGIAPVHRGHPPISTCAMPTETAWYANRTGSKADYSLGWCGG